MSWQTIDTAPRDGTDIDLWVVTPNGAGRVVDACWVSKGWDSAGSVWRSGWCAPYQDHEEDGFCDSSAKWRYRRDDETGKMRHVLLYEIATHWRPLPEAPPADEVARVIADAVAGAGPEPTEPPEPPRADPAWPEPPRIKMPPSRHYPHYFRGVPADPKSP